MWVEVQSPSEWLLTFFLQFLKPFPSRLIAFGSGSYSSQHLYLHSHSSLPLFISCNKNNKCTKMFVPTDRVMLLDGSAMFPCYAATEDPILGSCFSGGRVFSSQHLEPGFSHPRVMALFERGPTCEVWHVLHPQLFVGFLPSHAPWDGSTLFSSKMLCRWCEHRVTLISIWAPALLDLREGHQDECLGSCQLRLIHRDGHRPRKGVGVSKLTGILFKVKWEVERD